MTTDVQISTRAASAALEAFERAARALGPDAIVHSSAYGAEAFAVEQDRIFARVWNFCCHESEIAAAGDFLTLTVAGSPVIVNRDRNGELRAFYNTCLHRACRVIDAECGSARSFQCPYHHWTYGLDGSLRSLPGEEAYAGRPFDKGDFGLVPVRVDSVGGLVFVCLDDTTMSLREYLGDAVVRIIESVLCQAEFEVFEKRTFEIATNWKMWPENARDGYHVPFVHPKSLGPLSPPREYHLFGNGHAQQELSATQAYLSDEVWSRLMADPLPGWAPEEGWNLVLFPDTLLFLRGNVFFAERQDKVDARRTIQQVRVLGLVGDSEEQRRNRRQSWITWFEDPLQREDVPVLLEQQAGIETRGPQYSLVARGPDATTGLRGDDNRLRTFWDAWRHWMGTSENAWTGRGGPSGDPLS